MEIGRGNPGEGRPVLPQGVGRSHRSRYGRLDFRFYASIALLDAGDEEAARKERDRFAAEAAGLPPGSEAERLGAQIAFYQAAFLAMKGETAGLDALLAAAAAPYEKEPDAEKKGVEQRRALIRGIAAARSGRCEEAVALLRGIQQPEGECGLGGTQYYPAKDFGRVLVAGCLHDLGRNEEAEKELEPLLKRNPRFAPAVAVAARLKPGSRPPKPGPPRAPGVP